MLKDILRKYPDFVDDFVPLMARIQTDQIIENEGKIAFVWILGEFGHLIEASPYILEKMAEECRELNDHELSSALLISVFKLFFKRAPETKALFTKLFQEIVQTGTDTHLKQRAIFLYRLMQTDLNLAKQFALSTNSSFQEFFEDKNDEVRERLFQEFNSLSVVYQKPSERFLKETELKHSLASEKKYFPDRTRKGKLRGVEGATDDAAQADQSTNLLGDVTGGST